MNKKRHSLQISPAAYQKLSALADSSGVSYTEFVDHLLGIKKSESLSNKMEVGVDHNKIGNSIRDSIAKPPQEVMDSSILMCWRNHTEYDYEYWVGSNFTRREIIVSVSYHLTKNIDFSLEYRKFIMANSFGIDDKIQSTAKQRTVNPFKKTAEEENVLQKISTWANLYPTFFKHYLNNRSNFEIYCDNRLNALVKKGYIVRTDDGLYSINKNGLTATDWTVIQGVYNLLPQKHLNIPRLF
jgi:hypothetical protein